MNHAFGAGALIALASVLAACGQGGPGFGSITASPPPSAQTPGPTAAIRLDALRAFLAETNRRTLRVCTYVDPATAIADARARNLVEQDFRSLASSMLSSVPTTDVASCATRPHFLATNSKHPQNRGPGDLSGSGPLVQPSDVSPFVLFFVVTTDQRIRDIFGGLTTRRGSEQLLCQGGNCAEVTMSVYVTAAQLEDDAARKSALLEGLGFAGRT